MRASVAVAWPAFCAAYEGRCNWLYLDTKKLPTTGLGHRVFTLDEMQALDWRRKDGTGATTTDIVNEWHRILGRTDLAPKGGFAYQSVATLHLSNATVDGLLTSDTPTYWDPLVKVLPDLETWPADAQLALLDMSYNLGPYFLGSSWPNFTAAAKRADFTGCALFCLSKNKSPRDYRHQRLYTNASTVVMIGGDPETLWLDRTPSLPVPPDPTPIPDPEVPDVAKVKFRGGWTCSCVATSLPLVEKDMIRRGLIKYNIDIFQLGYRGGATSASKGTHDAGGCTDVAQRSTEFIKVWREWGWTMQDRSIAFPNDQHAHGWPYKCPHLAPDAEAQERDWDRKDAGLVGTGRVGGMWPIDDWKTAMKKRLAEQAERDRQKELELPTTSEVAKALAGNKDFLAAVADAVLNSDTIPNNGLTSNAANATVSPKTALSQLGKKSNDIAAKLDALIARFPEPDPTPPAA